MDFGTDIQCWHSSPRWDFRSAGADSTKCCSQFRNKRAWQSPRHRNLGRLVGFFSSPPVWPPHLYYSIANSTSDLLMMAAWSLTQEAVSDGPIPVRIISVSCDTLIKSSIHPYMKKTWYFARDDRVYKAFCSLLDQYQGNARQKLTKRLRWQIRVLRTVLEGRQMSWRVR